MSRGGRRPCASGRTGLQAFVWSGVRTVTVFSSAGDRVAEPVAVIGAGCRLPGGVDSLAALWRLLEEKRETVGPVPADRWDARVLGRALPDRVAAPMRFGGWLAGDIGAFDPQAFGMSGREAAWLDPQHRLLLMVAWEALENAGIPMQELRGSHAGVFAGLYSVDNLLRGHRRPQDSDPYWFSGGLPGVGVGRLSYLLDLHGPSLAVDTGCSSSLVAVHLACQALRAGECPLVVAAGVSAALGPEVSASSARWEMFSPTGRCRAFDQDADGYLRAEGCGVVVLKLLADAERDGDRVLAVLRGSAVNQDGHSDQLTVPSSRAQAAVFAMALRRAGVEASRVGMVEAHGTGTPVGDPLEFASLKEVYGAGRERCAIGSVKTNIGHTEPASGVVGLLKAIVSLRQGRVPASLHFTRFSSRIDSGGCRLFVPTETVDWPVSGRPRFAGVSSYGVGGTNAHVIVEEAPAGRRLPQPASQRRPAGAAADIFLLSAGSPAALRQAAGRLAGWVEGDGAAVPLRDVAYTLAVRRSHGAYRAGVVACGRQELAARLRRLAGGEQSEGVAQSRARPRAEEVVFVYSGHGSQWARMGRRLIGRDEAFTAALDKVEPLVRAESGFSVREVLAAKTVVSGMERVQPTLFALQVALTAMWRARGVEPAAVIGHSMGEVAAAVAAGALSVEDGVKVICRRSQLLSSVSGGAMAVVRLPADQLARVLQATGDDTVGVAVIASPDTTVISGGAARVDALLRQWEERGDVEAARVAVEVASHSAQMDPILGTLRERLAGLRPQAPSCTFYSTVTQDPRSPGMLDGGYWADNQRNVVRFASAVEAAAADGHRTFLEINAHPLLAAAVTATLEASGAGDAAVIPTLRRDRDEVLDVAFHLAALHCTGLPIPWERTYDQGRLADVPGTAWDLRHHWIAPSELTRGHGAAGGGAPGHPLLGTHLTDPAHPRRHLWHAALDAELTNWLKDHHATGMAVMPGAAWCEMALAAAAQVLDAPIDKVRALDVSFDSFLALDRAGLQLTSSATVQDGASCAWRIQAADDGRFEQLAGATLARAGNPPGPVPLEELLRSCPREADVRALRDRWATSCDVRYGPAFHTIRSLRLCDEDGRHAALARVSIPDPARAGTGAFHWHPALLDGCLQTLVAVWTTAVDLPEGNAHPLGIGELRVCGDTATGIYCHARAHRLDEHTVTGDVRLLDAGGMPVAYAENVRFAHTPRSSRADRLQSHLIRHRWEPRPLAAPSRPSPSTWLVLTETASPHPWHRNLLAALRRPHVCVQRFTLPLDDRTPAGPRLTAALRGGADPVTDVLLLLEPDTGRQPEAGAVARAERRTARLISTVQALSAGDTTARLHLLSHHGQAVPGDGRLIALGHAGLRGALRTLTYEYPELCPSLYDTDTSTPAEKIATQLLAEDPEDEVAWRKGQRYVARLAPAPLAPTERHTTSRIIGKDPVRADGSGPTLAYTVAESPGRLQRRQVVLTVRTTCRPALRTAGPPVHACAGTVSTSHTRALAAGQQVAALVREEAPANPVRTDANWCVPVPGHLDAAAAACSLLPYLTAHYALHHLARIRPGERVLTVGTRPLNKALRHTASAARARARTAASATSALRRGGCWDVIVDTTAEPDPRLGRLLAPAGRLLTTTPRLTLAQDTTGNTGTYTVDTGALAAAAPDTVADLLSRIADGLADNTLPPLPVTRLPLSALGRRQDTDRPRAHRWPTGTVTACLPPEQVPVVRTGSAYVISGGLGGLGMVLCQWLAGKGAGTIVLNSRSQPSRQTRDAIDTMRRKGTHIEVVTADLAETGTAEHLLRTAERHGHALRGIIHAAAVVEDATVARITPDLLQRVWRPKAHGAWLLHQASTGYRLDWWVAFSSFVPLLGSPGQTAYASASAWLDALIAYRAADGLPATGINWGAWAGAGIGARTLGKQGFTTIPVDDALAGLELLLTHARTSAGFVALDIDRWLEPYPAAATAPLLAPLLPAASPARAVGDSDRGMPAETLRQASPGQRGRMVKDLLIRQTAALLDCPPGRIDADTPLTGLGVDSLITVRLRNRLQQTLGVPLPRTVLRAQATLTTLADYLTDHLPRTTTGSTSPTEMPEASPPVRVESTPDGTPAPQPPGGPEQHRAQTPPSQDGTGSATPRAVRSHGEPAAGLPTHTSAWILDHRPESLAGDEHVRLEQRPLPPLGDGQVLIRNTHMSVHSAMLGQMLPTPLAQYCGVRGPLNPTAFWLPYAVGEAMTGPAIGEILASRADHIAPGDLVRHRLGWRTHAVADATAVEKLPDTGLDPTAHLGPLGLNGLTAYGALMDGGHLTDGDTVFVSAAAGAVGCLAGQIARLQGATRVVGSTGTPDKARLLTDTLGFDTAIDYTQGDIAGQLRAAAPDGIDVYFDNVGGDHLAAALDALRPRGRILLCGLHSQYAQAHIRWPDNLPLAIGKALHITGVKVFDYTARFPDFPAVMTRWLTTRALTCPVTVTHHIENAYQALQGLSTGKNTGQAIVQL
ncbi:type I polyketide synthase [Streptomyces sp. NRRL F-5755]|uniref:type I polyketide synthase n=1 Tax=Streptomyces sp. NRRL F-5755 TaxID=1519475 RepID=UPI00099CF2F9|nr:type I polyketide synthase [Streptomyces sp. NRRL F-5755]